MKDFIEVTVDGEPILIRIDKIESISGSTIVFDECGYPRKISVFETYKQIKEKIEQSKATAGIADNEAQWKYWGGWAGNHDLRLDDATCTKCGYVYPTIRHNSNADKLLPNTCPACGRKIVGHIAT